VRRFAFLIAGFLVLAVPASASAAGTATSVTGTAAGSDGLSVTWTVSTGKLGTTPVNFSLSFTKTGGTFGKAGYFFEQHYFSLSAGKKTFKYNKKTGKGSFKASLGTYGKVSIKFKGKGKIHTIKPFKGCTGPNTQMRTESVSGSITFSDDGLKTGKLRHGGSASRATSNKAGHCNPPGGGTPKCYTDSGWESISASTFGTPEGFVTFSATRLKAGAVVSESMSSNETMKAPGTFAFHSLNVIGAAGLMSESGGVATVTGAGHGMTGTLTTTGTVTSNPGTAPCGALTVNQINNGTPGGTGLTAALASGAISVDPNATGAYVTVNWEKDV
jgi:hypothetical protein